FSLSISSIRQFLRFAMAPPVFVLSVLCVQQSASFPLHLISNTVFKNRVRSSTSSRPEKPARRRLPSPLKTSALQLVLGRKQKFKMHDHCPSAPYILHFGTI